MKITHSSSRSSLRAALSVICVLSFSPIAQAGGLVNLLVENDVIAGTDRNYTSGVMLNYVSNINEGPRRLRDLGIRFPGIEIDDRMHVAVSLGHEIYTPTDIESREFLEDDRPYAGHVYLAAGFTTDNPEEIETWRLALGLVGPGARAEVIQNNLHREIGSPEAQGWDYQLKNEYVLSVAYEKKWLNLARSRAWRDVLQADFLPHASFSIGTPKTYAGFGGMVRLGHGLERDYGPPRVRPSLPVSQFYDPEGSASWYFFTGIDLQFIAHNLFLDGNNFRNSHSVDRRYFVADVQSGFVWNTSRFRLAYSLVYRTREFKNQDERDLFASMSISVHY